MGKQRRTASLIVAIVALTSVLVARAAGAATPVRTEGLPQLAWQATLNTWDQTSSPTIADVNGDGQNDIVFGAQDGVVRVLHADGTSVAGWPRQAGAAIDGPISVADLDRNGANELVVPTGSLGVLNQNGGVVVFNRDGGVRCRAATADVFNIWTGGPRDGFREPVYSAPAIGDVNGDGFPDIVFESWDHAVHAVDRFCHEIPGFPYDMADTLWPSPALYDVDGDGRMEIFVGIDSARTQGGAVVSLDWADNRVTERWRVYTNETIWSSPAIGDIDGDGRVDLVFGAGFFFKHSDSTKVFALHADSGSPLPGFPVSLGGWTLPSVALGDINGDGRTDVVAGAWNGTVQAFDGHGHRIWGRNMGVNGAVGSPIIADMNGDGRNDVGIGNIGAFHVIDGRTGGDIAVVNNGEAFWGAGAVGDFGSAGWRLVTIGFRTGSFHDSKIETFSLPAPRSSPPWPMFHRSASHTGAPLPTDRCRPASNPANNPSASSANGYWVLGQNGAVAADHAPYYGSAYLRMGFAAARKIVPTASGRGYYVLSSAGAILTFGDARSYGSMAGRRLHGAIIGIAPTPSGRGYWLLGSDGGIFTFGDARFFGSTGAMRLHAPIIGMASTSTGHGYWLLGSDGGIFTFGDARFYGSTGAMRLAAPVISMAVAPSGTGYWLVALDGGVFSFHVPFYGSGPGMGLCSRPVGLQIRPTLSGHGYYVVVADGRVLPFGDAKFFGNGAGMGPNNFAVDLAVRPF